MVSAFEGYQIREARTILDRPHELPAAGGLYAFGVEDRSPFCALLLKRGLGLGSLRLGTHPLIYLGASDESLRRRIRVHFKSDTQGSDFRISLSAVLAEHLELKRELGGHPPTRLGKAGEARLTKWMFETLKIVFCEVRRPKAVESELIQNGQPSLNISGRRATPGGRHLLALRRHWIATSIQD